MIWILSLRWGWCGPYLPESVLDHLRPLAGVAVAGDSGDETEAVRVWAEDLEPAIALIERDPPVGLAVMPDFRFTVRVPGADPVQLYGFERRPNRGDGRTLAELCVYWARGGCHVV